MTRLLLAAKILSLTALSAMLGALTWLALDLRQTVGELRATASAVRATAQAAETYLAAQLAVLRDPRNQKSLEAGIQAAAVWNATGRLVNTQTIPRVNRTLDELQGSAADLRALVAESNRRINAELLPGATQAIGELAGAARSLDAGLREAQETLQVASGAARTVGEDIHRLLSDPALLGAARAIEQAATRSAETAAHIERAAREVPEIARSAQEIAATSSRYRRWVLLSQIASALGRAFW